MCNCTIHVCNTWNHSWVSIWLIKWYPYERKLQKAIESGTTSTGRKQLLFRASSKKKLRHHQLSLIYETSGQICLNWVCVWLVLPLPLFTTLPPYVLLLLFSFVCASRSLTEPYEFHMKLFASVKKQFFWKNRKNLDSFKLHAWTITHIHKQNTFINLYNV